MVRAQPRFVKKIRREKMYGSHVLGKKVHGLVDIDILANTFYILNTPDSRHICVMHMKSSTFAGVSLQM